jgi:hypothetical protein
MMISDKKTDEKARVNAIEIAKEIDNDETRLFVLDKIGYTGAQNSSYYTRIKEFTGKILAGGKEHGQIDALEKLIRLSPNRPKTAQIFCNIAAVFKRNGKPRIAKRFVAAATGEARITRPLSQRAYVLCDIAMILNAARCLEEAQGIIELAINAATNIRQFYIRDEVFDDLAYAMRFMRE